MERIASFCVDHTKLEKGVYVSRIDGDITTYDIRMRKPNVEEVMDNGAIHTIEHLFATYARNCEYKDSVIYFGPMGCRTGCYFLTRNLDNATVLSIIKEAFRFIADFEGEIPGSTAVECGNYRDHNLELAKKEAREFIKILQPLTAENMHYQQ
ncbi:MAG: S-ribosylhomocysteine lyase [Acutalibacteraceae bacterium]|nr:S-ribosylhomocysteine lyase [Acutalibacteraceae bacterium]